MTTPPAQRPTPGHDFSDNDHALNVLMVLMALEWYVGAQVTATGRVERVASILELTASRRGEPAADELLDELAISAAAAGIQPDDFASMSDGLRIAAQLLQYADTHLGN